MFSLVIVLIAIVLVVVLALAALYYGGSAFNNAAVGAQVDRLVNESTQIKAAVTLYQAEQGTAPTSLAQLQSQQSPESQQYLRQLPPNWVGDGSVNATNGAQVAYTVQNNAQAAELCRRFNVKYGIPYDTSKPIPSCSTVSGTVPVCCGP